MLAGILLPTAHAETVALGSFAHADFERNDPDTSAALATAVQAGLDAKARWKFVERAETDRIFDELGLSRRELVSADTAARIGKLLKADLLLAGTFFTPKDAKPYVILECDELVRAEPVGQARVELGNILEKGHLTLPSPEDLQRIVAAGARLLGTSMARIAAQRDRTILKLLFLTNKAHDPSLKGLERLVATGLEQASAASSSHRMLRLERPEIATQESELALLGLVEADATAWVQVADYYLWGSYQGTKGDVTLSLTLWDGRRPPQEITETATRKDLPALAGRIANRVLAAARPLDRHAGTDAGIDQRNKVSVLLSQQAKTTFDRVEKRRLLAAAVFFSPAQKDSWLQLLAMRLADDQQAASLPALLRQVGDLEYGFEVAERFWVSPSGQIDPEALDGVVMRFSQYADVRFARLQEAVAYFEEDFKDVYVGRNLLALNERVTTSYRGHILRLARVLATAAPGQDDNYRKAAEFILTTALQQPFTPQERRDLINLLWPRLKIVDLVHRAWYPTGDRLRQLDGLLRSYYIDLHQPDKADALNLLSPDELTVALAAPAPAGSPGMEKLESVQRGLAQIAGIRKNAPGGQLNAGMQKFLGQREAEMAAAQAACTTLQTRAHAYLRAHGEARIDLASLLSELLQGPSDNELALFHPPLESYPAAAKGPLLNWLRDTTAQRANEGYPAVVLERMRTIAGALERETAAAPPAPAGPMPPEWTERKPGYLEPRTAGFLLASYARTGDLPSLQALLARGAPIEAAGAAVVGAIRQQQWPAVYYLLGRGYDPTAPWPEMDADFGSTFGWSDHPGRNALAEAAVLGRTDLLDLFLKKGVRFGPKSGAGAYAVRELVKSGRHGLLRQVLAAGAPASRLPQYPDRPEPLYLAIEARDLAALKLLVEAGADPTGFVGTGGFSLPGLNGSNEWQKFNDRSSDRSLQACARQNWLEGAQVLLAAPHADLARVLAKEWPHRLATAPAVRAIFLRAELEAASDSTAANHAGIDLFTAIAAGDQTGFAAALARPGCLQFRGLWGESALMFACQEKNRAMARQLLAAHASLDEFDTVGSTPLCYAARNGDIELVEAMVRLGADINLSRGRANRPLDQAIIIGHDSAMVLKLIELHASHAPHPRDPALIPLFQATIANLPDVVRELIRLGDNPRQIMDGFSIFFPAARSNNPELIQLYFDLKCDLNKRNNAGWTPLVSAVRWGAAASVQKLLELGLRDPNAATLAVSMIKDPNPTDRPDPAELHALHYRPDYRRCLEIMEDFGQIAGSPAAQDSIFWHAHHTVPEMEAYVAAGGNINFRGNSTPLQDAANFRDLPKAAFLLGKGADPNLTGTDRNEESPLGLALDRPPMVELLLMHGANPNERMRVGLGVGPNGIGCSLLAWTCVDSSFPIETIRLLIRYGANPDIDARAVLAQYGRKNDLRGIEQVNAALNGK